jgi:PAS domain S-box-containing protein
MGFNNPAPPHRAPRLETVLAGISDAFVTLDREWRFTFVNEKAAEINGYPTEELLGRVCWEVFPSAVGTAFHEQLHRAMAEQREVRFEGYHAHLNSWLENRVYPTPDGLSIFTADITERKRAEEALQFLADAGAVLAASLDSTDILGGLARLIVPRLADWCAIDLLGLDGSLRRLTTVRIDPALAEHEEALGFAPARVLRTGQPCRIAKVTEEIVQELAESKDALSRLRSFGLRSLLSVPLRPPGRIAGVLTFANTRSTRRYGPEDLELALGLAHVAALALDNARLFERMVEDDRRKDEFLTMLAHELRNPLAPIVNGAEMLRLRGDDPAVRARTLELISRQARHMARLLEDLLDISRIRHGKVELRREPVEMSELLRRTADAAHPTAESRGLEILLTALPEPVWVDGDPARLEQVLANLVSNAIKFTPAGGRVELIGEASGDNVLLRVRDNGAGIPADLAEHIFDPFVQEDRSLDRSQGGLGIGLTLVRTLVVLHGGSVEAHSAGRSQGSEFVVRLPRCSPPQEAAAVPVPPPAAEERRRKVLVVEDNPDAAAALSDLLDLWGYEVVVAGDSDAALRVMDTFTPRILLLDIGLPGMDGYELARHLRARLGPLKARFIALTGYGQASDRQRSAEAGFDHHLTKPVDPPMLKELLGRRE